MPAAVDPPVRDLAEQVIAAGRPKRAVLVLQVMLDRGSINTDEIADLGYGHPPRAIRDARDAGVPIITTMVTSPRTGKSMAVYSFGAAAHIQDGRIGGRSAFSLAFKRALVERYGSLDCISRARLPERVLQIDHRIPYLISGDVGLADRDVEAYMLLDGSSQRAKSWSCETCPNMAPERRDKQVCETCYWARPEAYKHVAMQPIRRTDVVWQGTDVVIHDQLEKQAMSLGLTVADLLRQLVRTNSSEA